MEEAELTARVRQLLAKATLPRKAPLKMFGGRPSGSGCSICGEMFGAEFEFELDFGGEGPVLRVHRRCYDVWERERRLAG